MAKHRQRQCVSCRSLLFLWDGERPASFRKRMTCHNGICSLQLRAEGARYPMWRETEGAVGDAEPLVPRVVPEALLLARRVPSYLLQPVDNNVDNLLKTP